MCVYLGNSLENSDVSRGCDHLWSEGQMQMDDSGGGRGWRNMVCIVGLALLLSLNGFPSLWAWNAAQEARGYWPALPAWGHTSRLWLAGPRKGTVCWCVLETRVEAVR